MNTDRCTATARSTGARCKRVPLPGSTVCRSHGGNAPQVRQKAAERVAAQEALDTLARHGVTPTTNPLEALAELAGEVLTVKNIFRDRVAQLSEEQWRRADDRGGEQLRAELSLYERALDRAGRVLADIARLKIDERLTAISEQQGLIIAELIVKVMDQLGIDAHEPHVRELLVAELRQVSERNAA